MQKKNSLLILLLGISLLNSCSRDTNLSAVQKEQISEKKATLTNDGKSLEASKDAQGITKKLSINEKCIGCWKCVMRDPKHFKINMEKFRPDVISQEDIHSPATQNAISVCPVGAIYIG